MTILQTLHSIIYQMQINRHIMPLEILQLQAAAAAATDAIANGERARDKSDKSNKNIFHATKYFTF